VERLVTIAKHRRLPLLGADVGVPDRVRMSALGLPHPVPSVAYTTARGVMYQGFAEEVLRSPIVDKYRHNVQLILTSPPFPLNRKKKYGNRQGEEYVTWLAAFAPIFKEILTDDGSIVVEMGNVWEPGEPAMSTIALEALLSFLKAGDLKLCQQFICHNPARLPTPAQWVNIDRIRVKDSYTHVWWMAPTTRPKADNRRVLKPYSRSMLKLLKTQKYNSGRRPSEHRIGATSFLKDNDGAIPSNVLTLTNTLSNEPYLTHCRKQGLPLHPARQPHDLATFFIKFLTEARDVVLDPFAGSNTTGAAAEDLKRRWLAIEPNGDYLEGSRGRFAATS
jgi:site-specific DNA-methyltransferase (cytosine-N4-specific)